MTRTAWIVGVGVLSCCALACGDKKGSGSAGQGSPRATAESLVGALAAADADTAQRLLPPVDMVRASLDCPNDNLIEAIERQRKRVPKEFSEMKKEKVQIELGEFDKEGSETRTFKAGEAFRDCTVKQPISVHRSKLTLKITQKGETDDDGETWSFIKFGDEERWYFFK